VNLIPHIHKVEIRKTPRQGCMTVIQKTSGR